MIAQHVLGLGRPNYSPPAKKTFLEPGDHLRGQQFERLVGSAVMGEQHDLPESQP